MYLAEPFALCGRSGVCCGRWYSNAQKKAPPSVQRGACSSCNSLTMTYFHTGTRTIIGAESFHCPVRDGKEWDQLAMVIRHNLELS